MITVDTSVWIDYFNGKSTAQTEHLDLVLGTTILVVGDLVLAEVLQGFRNDKDYKIAKSLLEACELVSFTSPTLAIKSASNYRTLRKKGITIRKTIDCLIATYCVENKLPLLHTDKDFLPFENHLKLKTALPL
ncbi:MAG: PIN domain nuclease [Pseudomonadales bacterium]|nr:PIN domain nuclease [Pseudomonadales bacterium]